MPNITDSYIQKWQRPASNGFCQTFAIMGYKMATDPSFQYKLYPNKYAENIITALNYIKSPEVIDILMSNWRDHVYTNAIKPTATWDGLSKQIRDTYTSSDEFYRMMIYDGDYTDTKQNVIDRINFTIDNLALIDYWRINEEIYYVNPSKHTPKKSSSKHTPKNSASKHTPKKSASKHTPKKSASKHTLKNSASKYSPKKSVTKYSPKKSVTNKNNNPRSRKITKF